jgi:hypothetical protein
METKDVVAAVIAGLSAAIALVTLIRALLEYGQQGRQKRADQFFALRRRLKEAPEFRRIAGLIDRGAPAADELANTSFEEKRDYLGLFEEVALVLNSRLITPEVAHYMFGYYALRCWESDGFWTGVNRESHYWSLFADFVGRMRNVEDSFVYRRDDFSF